MSNIARHSIFGIVLLAFVRLQCNHPAILRCTSLQISVLYLSAPLLFFWSEVLHSYDQKTVSTGLSGLLLIELIIIQTNL
jgi:hypothetical protein